MALKSRQTNPAKDSNRMVSQSDIDQLLDELEKTKKAKQIEQNIKNNILLFVVEIDAFDRLKEDMFSRDYNDYIDPLRIVGARIKKDLKAGKFDQPKSK